MDTKSYGEFILGVYDALLVDCASHYPDQAKEFRRDFQRLSSAIDQHGLRFFLDTLPAFRKHFDQCLQKERLTSSGLIHFGADKKGGTIPRLFRGLILRVFDRNGLLRPSVDKRAIRLVRQLLGAVRKLRMAANARDCGNAVREFYRTDMEVRHGILDWTRSLSDQCTDQCQVAFSDHSTGAVIDQTSLFETTSSSVPTELLVTLQRVADLFSSQLGVFNPYDWKPRHGPGAVAGQRYGSYKYDFTNWPDRLESVFPVADFAYANSSLVDPLTRGELLSSGYYREIPAQLHAVPKTISKPRLIAAEPTSLQWCQQVVRDYLATRVSKTFIGSIIDFRRQDLNGKLALRASRDRSHSTIDLSEASDRISCWHVERLFRRLPSLLDALQASRSAWIKQDICSKSPHLHKVRKYSTMGNATTFPVQSLLFGAMAVACVLHVRKLPVTYKSVRRLGKWQVRIFGDDIIIPKDASAVMVELLQALYLKVNSQKTFVSGSFRESCGVDAYDGDNVSTVSILDVPRDTGPGSIVSSVDVFNNLLTEGYWHTANFIRKIAERSGYSRIRTVKHGSGLFGWSDLCGGDNSSFKTRWNHSLQRAEIRCLTQKVKAVRSSTVETSGLLQFFTEAAVEVTNSTSSIGWLVQRPKARLVLGWAPL